jgi:hypothetical protein
MIAQYFHLILELNRVQVLSSSSLPRPGVEAVVSPCCSPFFFFALSSLHAFVAAVVSGQAPSAKIHSKAKAKQCQG